LPSALTANVGAPLPRAGAGPKDVRKFLTSPPALLSHPPVADYCCHRESEARDSRHGTSLQVTVSILNSITRFLLPPAHDAFVCASDHVSETRLPTQADALTIWIIAKHRALVVKLQAAGASTSTRSRHRMAPHAGGRPVRVRPHSWLTRPRCVACIRGFSIRTATSPPGEDGGCTVSRLGSQFTSKRQSSIVAQTDCR
jgi:hypothetical protein